MVPIERLPIYLHCTQYIDLLSLESLTLSPPPSSPSAPSHTHSHSSSSPFPSGSPLVLQHHDRVRTPDLAPHAHDTSASSLCHSHPFVPGRRRRRCRRRCRCLKRKRKRRKIRKRIRRRGGARGRCSRLGCFASRVSCCYFTCDE